MRRRPSGGVEIDNLNDNYEVSRKEVQLQVLLHFLFERQDQAERVGHVSPVYLPAP